MPATSIASVERALRILSFLSEKGYEGASLGTISEYLNISKSGAHHTLSTMKLHNFVEKDPISGKYCLGVAAGEIAAHWYDEKHIVQRLHPILEKICAASTELVHLGKLIGNEIVYLDKVEAKRILRVWSEIGKRAPAVSTALGRAIIGADPKLIDEPEYFEKLFDGLSDSQVMRKRFQEECLRVQNEGWACEIEENEAGIACVSVPVYHAKRVVAAISITTPVDRISPARQQELVKIIREELLNSKSSFTPVPLCRRSSRSSIEESL